MAMWKLLTVALWLYPMIRLFLWLRLTCLEMFWNDLGCLEIFWNWMKLEEIDEIFDSCIFPQCFPQVLVQQRHQIAQWWPSMTEDDTGGKPLSGLVLPGNGRKRKKRATHPDSAKGDDGPDPDDKKSKKAAQAHKKTTKKQMMQEKVAQPIAPADAGPNDIKRTPAGEKVIKTVMNEIKKSNILKFPDQPLWDSEDLCRLNVGKCMHTPWSHFCNHVFLYFKGLYLRFCLKDFPFVFFCFPPTSSTLYRIKLGWLMLSIFSGDLAYMIL